MMNPTKPPRPFDPEDPARRELRRLLEEEAEWLRYFPQTREALERIEGLVRETFLALGRASNDDIAQALDLVSKSTMTALLSVVVDVRSIITSDKARDLTH